MSPRATLLNHRDRFEVDGRFAAIVLAGTYGWGGVDVPHLPPRSLAEVVFEPAISYPLEWLREGGATRAIVCANGASDLIQARLGNLHHGLSLDYAADRLPRGPGGCVRDAAVLVGGDPIVVVESTVIPTVNLDDLLVAHRESGAALTVVTRPATADDEPTPAGIYVLSRQTVDQISTWGFQDIKEGVIPQLARAGRRVATFAAPEPCPRIADLDSYLQVNQWMVDRLVAACRDGDTSGVWVSRGEQLVHPSAVVHPSALLIGPVVIGRKAQVGPDATVVGPAVIGAEAVVAPRALISRSVVGSGAYIASEAMVHQCVIADASFIDSTEHLHHTAPERTRRRDADRRLWSPATRPDHDGVGTTRPVPALPLRAARPLHIAAVGRDALSEEEVVGA